MISALRIRKQGLNEGSQSPSSHPDNPRQTWDLNLSLIPEAAFFLLLPLFLVLLLSSCWGPNSQSGMNVKHG